MKGQKKMKTALAAVTASLVLILTGCETMPYVKSIGHSVTLKYMDSLLEKGKITQAQYDEVKKAMGETETETKEETVKTEETAK